MTRWMHLLVAVLSSATGAASGITSAALAADIGRTPPVNDTCDQAIEIYGGGSCAFFFEGTTRGATNDYDPYDSGGGESCLAQSALGPDVVYKAYLGGYGGGLLYVDLFVIGEWDAVMYILSDCAAPASSCLAAGDRDHPIEFWAADEGWYYLVIDSNGGEGEFQGYSVSGVIGSWATPAEATTWGLLKSLHR